MPEKSQQRNWARETIGWFEVKDASLPRIEKSEAIENLHQFLFHGLENKVTLKQLKGYLVKAHESLTLKEMAKACLDHWKMERHGF